MVSFLLTLKESSEKLEFSLFRALSYKENEKAIILYNDSYVFILC
jgi:hypothetical protein